MATNSTNTVEQQPIVNLQSPHSMRLQVGAIPEPGLLREMDGWV